MFAYLYIRISRGQIFDELGSSAAAIAGTKNMTHASKTRFQPVQTPMYSLINDML